MNILATPAKCRLWRFLVLIAVAFFPGPADASDPLKIALILARTGIAAEDNAPAVRAAELAIQEINEQGGLRGHPLAYVVIDNQSCPIGAKKAAEKAVKQKVTAVIGALWSSHCLPMARTLQDARIPMITPTASNPGITRTGDCIFRVCFDDAFQGRVMAQFAYSVLGCRRAAVLRNSNEEYSLTLAEYFTLFFEQSGGKAPWQGNYKGTAVDFTELLREVKLVHPDAFFIPGYARDSGLVVKQAVGLGIRTTFLGGDGWGDTIFEYAGNALEGSYYSTHWHPEVPFVASRHLQKQYRERYGINRVTDVRIPLTYDAVHLFADAVRRAGSGDRSRILESLARTRDFRGATGTVTFDPNGDPVSKEAGIIKFERGSWVFVKSVSPK
ncbi:MAG: ABC transporter substrate-binding protein [Deltaproteobacteria bacterium]|nr:ABC transporter substrate-binding protein [Deltaproteobacteria bacterium]